MIALREERQVCKSADTNKCYSTDEWRDVSAAALKRIRENKRGGGGQTEGESQK
ncbi:hypothetical protein PO909_028956 [Leuciscus waleckii]